MLKYSTYKNKESSAVVDDVLFLKEVNNNKLIVTNNKLLPRDIIEEYSGCSMATNNPEIIKLKPTNNKDIEYNFNTETV